MKIAPALVSLNWVCTPLHASALFPLLARLVSCGALSVASAGQHRVALLVYAPGIAGVARLALHALGTASIRPPEA